MDNQPTAENDRADLLAIKERTTLTVAAGNRLLAVQDILKERRHQIDRGHTPLADGALALGKLSAAAFATIAAADDAGPVGAIYAQTFWPFDYRQRPESELGRRHLLVKAAALLLAELERLPREPAPGPVATLLLTNGEGGR